MSKFIIRKKIVQEFKFNRTAGSGQSMQHTSMMKHLKPKNGTQN